MKRSMKIKDGHRALQRLAAYSACNESTEEAAFLSGGKAHTMITNHACFIEAIKEKKKVCVRFYSEADSGVLDRVCAPLDYGPGEAVKDGLNRYWLWDYGSLSCSHTLGLVSGQIVDLRVLGEMFDPAHVDVRPAQWSIPRDWGS